MSLNHLTATELLQRLRTGELSSAAVTESYCDSIQRHNDRLGVFVSFNSQTALDQAEQIDAKRRRGEPVGPLNGIPVAVKDLLCTQGWTTTCGSRMLSNFVPPYDAMVVEKLRQADAVILGKTNLDEFAMGSSTESSAFGVTRNPWDSNLVPGGSSGGAAACVAASMAPLSIGTDTGGSIRQPASFCGVVGLKPTYGRVSRYGLVAFASSLDQIGPLARTVQDTAHLMQMIAGNDRRDSTSADIPVPDYVGTVNQPLTDLKLGVVPEHFSEGMDGEVAQTVRAAIDVYRQLGAKIVDISLPHGQYAIATYYIIAPSEASSNLARYDGVHYGHRTNEQEMLAELDDDRKRLSASGRNSALDDLESGLVRMYRRTRSEGFGDEVKRRIMLGTYALSAGYYDAYYLKALKVRRLIRRDYDEAFGKVDFVIGPVTPTPAFGIGEKTSDPLSMYLGDLYTVSANLAGIPAISVPCGFTDTGLPIGLQLQGPAFGEDRLLRAAQMYQTATQWHTQVPDLQ